MINVLEVSSIGLRKSRAVVLSFTLVICSCVYKKKRVEGCICLRDVFILYCN